MAAFDEHEPRKIRRAAAGDRDALDRAEGKTHVEWGAGIHVLGISRRERPKAGVDLQLEHSVALVGEANIVRAGRIIARDAARAQDERAILE